MKFDEQIDHYLEGRLSADEALALEQQIACDMTLAEAYVNQAWLHASLKTSTALADRAPGLSAKPREEKHREFRNFAFGAIAAAFAVAACFLLIRSESGAVLDPVATLEKADGTRWAGSDLPTVEGAELVAGTLHLVEGMATLAFVNGASVTLEAPCRFELIDEMQCRLHEGSIVADVPDSAHGFTIDTQQLEVVDLGTKFGVTATPLGGDHVFVFDGEVEVREIQKDSADSPTLVTGGRSLHFGGSAENQAEAPRPTNLDATANLRGDQFLVSTATGGGKDTFIRRGHQGSEGSSPLLMAKHTELAPNNERRTLLGFDLIGWNAPEASDVVLQLQTRSSGLGFGSLVPDSVFEVFGVLDPALDEWSENELNWSTVSAFSDTELDPQQFRRLASFTIKRGAAHETVEIRSEALTDFYNTRRGALATILIARVTGG
ncbi:MAG: hypothetical protein AAF236_14410, partial [Verrucomicrobiota bacterium]